MPLNSDVGAKNWTTLHGRFDPYMLSEDSHSRYRIIQFTVLDTSVIPKTSGRLNKICETVVFQCLNRVLKYVL